MSHLYKEIRVKLIIIVRDLLNYKKMALGNNDGLSLEIQDVPLATEPGISLIFLTTMKILQRNLNRSTFVV